MANLYLDICTAYVVKASLQAACVSKFEHTDVSDCSGFIPLVLRDTLGI